MASPQRRESMQQEMQYGAEASPVDYDLHEGEELHDEVVGMLDVIDDHVSTGTSVGYGGTDEIQ